MAAPVAIKGHPELANRDIVPQMPDFEEAVALVSSLRYNEAEPKFRKLSFWYESAGDKERAAECVFWIGFCLEKRGKTAEARLQYDKAMRQFSGTSAARLSAERVRRLTAAPVAAPTTGPAKDKS
jgi:TolA-binding protein